MTRFTNSKLDKSDVLNTERSHGYPDHWITIRHQNRKYRCRRWQPQPPIMGIFHELRYTIIELVRTFYLNGVAAKFKKINLFLELSAWQVLQNRRATLVIPTRTSVATIVTIRYNHRDGEYYLYRIFRKLWSTALSTLIKRLLLLTDYISATENETLWVLLGHTNGNIEMRSSSAASMMTMVAWFSPVRRRKWNLEKELSILITCSSPKISEFQTVQSALLW